MIATPDELDHLALIPQTAGQRRTGHQPLHLAARKAQVGMQKKNKRGTKSSNLQVKKQLRVQSLKVPSGAQRGIVELVS